MVLLFSQQLYVGASDHKVIYNEIYVNKCKNQLTLISLVHSISYLWNYSFTFVGILFYVSTVHILLSKSLWIRSQIKVFSWTFRNLTSRNTEFVRLCCVIYIGMKLKFICDISLKFFYVVCLWDEFLCIPLFYIFAAKIDS